MTPAVTLLNRVAGSSGTGSVTTDLHDTGKGRAGESQKSNRLDHFEKLKSLSWKKELRKIKRASVVKRRKEIGRGGRVKGVYMLAMGILSCHGYA